MTEDPRDLVSVVVPTYNRSIFLGAALNSILNQSYPAIEIIVVDDGSTDDTPAYLERFGEGIQVIRHEDRRGPAAARNTGIRNASGQYIAFLDSDDVWKTSKLSRQLPLFTENKEVGLVGGGAIPVDSNGQPASGPTYGPDRVGYQDLCIRDALPGGTSNAVVRRAVLDDVGLFDESLPRNEDRDLWMRIAEKYEIQCVRDVTVAIRWHDHDSRPDTRLPIMKECRLNVNGRIEDTGLRLRANAWTWFHLFRMSMIMKEERVRYEYVLYSALTWPFSIPGVPSRLRTLGRILKSNILGE